MEESVILENIPNKKPLFLKDLVHIEEGSIVSKILVQNDAVSLTLFALAKGQEISTHQSDGDAFVQVVEGVGTFFVDGVKYSIPAEQCLVMPHHHPHALKAEQDFKMLLGVIY
jgi:quercetin dioxygenase-like cupin family protein